MGCRINHIFTSNHEYSLIRHSVYFLRNVPFNESCRKNGNAGRKYNIHYQSKTNKTEII